MSNPNDTAKAPEQAENKAGGCTCADKAQEPSQAPEMPPQMPEVTFTTFVLSLASSALVQLGEVPDPESGQTTENILMAKHTIDVLSMLRDKTYGCLDEDERKIMDGLLYELRMKYVLKAK